MPHEPFTIHPDARAGGHGFRHRSGPDRRAGATHLAGARASPCAAGAGLCAGAGATAGTHILITNRGTLALQAQSAFSWSALGTPAPRGGMQALAQDLAPGQSVALPLGAMLHAAGCVAALVPAH